MESETRIMLSGRIAAEAALLGEAREVHAVHVDEAADWRKLEPVRRAAKKRSLELNPRPRAELDTLAGHPGHGGVVAEAGPRRYVGLDELVHADAPGVVVMLDGVEDPHNLGAAVRALWPAGIDGVIVRPRQWDPAAESTIVRASAGATERMPMAEAESPEAAAAFVRTVGYRVAVTEGGKKADGVSLYDADLAAPLLIVIGGERRGIRRAFRDAADVSLTIPYAVRFDWSLGAVAAAAVIGFEVARRRSVDSAPAR